MPKPDIDHGADQSTAGMIGRLQQWWRGRRDLDRLSAGELTRVARELGMTIHELKGVMASGPHAADLLYRRMKALELTQAAVERMAPGLMRDLQVSCCSCSAKARCKADLAANPAGTEWTSYCSNAVDLLSLAETASDPRGLTPR